MFRYGIPGDTLLANVAAVVCDTASLAFPLLSLHRVTLDPDNVIAFESAPSSHIAQSGRDLGSNAKYCWTPKFTPVAIV